MWKETQTCLRKTLKMVYVRSVNLLFSRKDPWNIFLCHRGTIAGWGLTCQLLLLRWQHSVKLEAGSTVVALTVAVPWTVEIWISFHAYRAQETLSLCIQRVSLQVLIFKVNRKQPLRRCKLYVLKHLCT